jgi:uncharacterized protein
MAQALREILELAGKMKSRHPSLPRPRATSSPGSERKRLMISTKERQKLHQLLALAEEQGSDVFSIPRTLGYLYGLAITPEMIVPSEWLPVIFGEELPEFESEDQAKSSFDNLFRIYNRLTNAFHQGELAFPYDLTATKDWTPEEIEEWTYGLYRALRLRPECWFREELPLSLDEEGENHMASLAVITAIAKPERAEKVFGQMLGAGEKETDLWASLFAVLPAAIQALQDHAAVLEKERQADHAESLRRGRPVIAEKIGRNAPCPCGSGKKYKKCCLGNRD